MNIKQLLLSLLLVISNIYGNAQDFTLDSVVNRNTHLYAEPYKRAIGVKMYPSAISYKQFIRSNKAYELLGYFTLDGFRATALYEKYMPIEGNEQLTWYVGYGGHLGLWNDTWKLRNPNHPAGIALGVDGIIGLDYKVKNAPLNLSVDWQPSFNFVGASYFESGWAGIGVRYTF
ncbi:MAG: hypothetical protein RLZ56_623 [Bacteroidota bacterium]|jgi:hypothetical protein